MVMSSKLRPESWWTSASPGSWSSIPSPGSSAPCGFTSSSASYSWGSSWTSSMASTPSTWSTPHYLHCFRLHLLFSRTKNEKKKKCQLIIISWLTLHISWIFQFHYLFQTRVAGDIFVSGENIEENLPDFQDYVNNTCTMYVILICMVQPSKSYF